MTSRRSLVLASLIVTNVCVLSCGDGEPHPAPGDEGGAGGAAGAGDQGGDGDEAGQGGDGGEAGRAGGGGHAGNSENAGNAGAGGQGLDPCTLPWSAPREATDCDLDALDEGEKLSDSVEADVVLAGGKVHYLEGKVRVRDGFTLTVEPCSKIVAKGGDTSLTIYPGAKLVAVGEANAPIVFTTDQPKGARAAGDWGGITVMGRAQTNSGEATLSGISVKFGSETSEFDDESSGALAYVRIEFGGYVGYELGDSSRAALTLAGVGSATEVHHVQVLHSAADCFQWLGGSSDAHHLVGIGCMDDIFDAELGYQGEVQFAFGRQWEGEEGELSIQDRIAIPNGASMDAATGGAINFLPSSNGLELNNVEPYNSERATATPLTTASWSNITLCGQKRYDVARIDYPPGSSELVNARRGLFLRGNTGGSIENTIVTGFQDGFSFVHDDPSDPAITVEHTILGENRAAVRNTPTNPSAPLTWFTDQPGNKVLGVHGLCDCWANPPLPFPPSLIEGGPGSPSDAPYIGAFADASAESNWMVGLWVDFSEN